MKWNNILYNFFFLFYASFFFINCATRQIHYDDNIQLLSDNFWVDKNTLQIQVESSSEENVPYTWRRATSCKQAENMIDDHFRNLYPDKDKLRYRKVIYKRLYTDKSNCRLVVHLHLENFQEKLK